MTKIINVNAALSETNCVYDILSTNEALNDVLGENTRNLVSKLSTDLIEGDMTQYHFSKAMQALTDLLIGATGGDLEKIESARIELQCNTKFSRNAFNNESSIAQIIGLVITGAVFFALILANIAIPFIVLPITIVAIFPVMYLLGLAGEDIGVAINKSNINTLCSKVTFFGNRSTESAPVVTAQTQELAPATSLDL